MTSKAASSARPGTAQPQAQKKPSLPAPDPALPVASLDAARTFDGPTRSRGLFWGAKAPPEITEMEEEHPALRQYREMDAAVRAHNNALIKQAKIVENALYAAETVASQPSVAIISSETTRDSSGLMRREVSETVRLGPRLRKPVGRERVEECRRVLFNHEETDSADAIESGRLGLLSSPIEALEMLSGHNERIVCDGYELLVELCAELQPKKSHTLQPHVSTLRQLLSTMMLNSSVARDYCNDLRNEIQLLEGRLQSTTRRKDESCRAATELLNEVQALRSQIFKTIGDTSVPESMNPDVTGRESDRAIVMLQIEGTHQLRVQRPVLVSEALLQARIIIDGAVAKFEGRRTNFNSAFEAKEVFDGAKNCMFPPQSFMIDFDLVSDAAACCAFIHHGLLTKIDWSSQLLSIPEFAEVHSQGADKGPLVWGGLRVRAAIHVGPSRVAMPFANSKDSQNCPFLSGMACDRAMQLLRVAKGGQTLVTEHAAAVFQKLRFADPRVCADLQLKTVQVAGMPGGKLSSFVSEALQLRETPAFAPRAVDEKSFPPVAFWRSQEGEDLSKLQFGSEASAEARTVFTSKEYEARIEAMEASASALTAKVAELEAEISSMMDEFGANRDTAQQAGLDLKRATGQLSTLSGVAQRLAKMLALSEQQSLAAHDEIARVKAAAAASAKELSRLQLADAAQKKRRFVAAEVQTAELVVVRAPMPPPPAVELVVKEPEPCADCKTLRLVASAAHSTLRTLATIVDDGHQDKWEAAEILPIFERRTRSSVKDLTKRCLQEVTQRTAPEDIVDSLLGNACMAVQKLVELSLRHKASAEALEADKRRDAERSSDERKGALAELSAKLQEQVSAAAADKTRYTTLNELFLELVRALSSLRREMEEVSQVDEMIGGIAPMLSYFATIASEIDTDGKRIEQENHVDGIVPLIVARGRRRAIAREARSSDFDEQLIALKQTFGQVRKTLAQVGDLSPRRLASLRSFTSPRTMMSASPVSASPRGPELVPTSSALGQIVMTTIALQRSPRVDVAASDHGPAERMEPQLSPRRQQLDMEALRQELQADYDSKLGEVELVHQDEVRRVEELLRDAIISREAAEQERVRLEEALSLIPAHPLTADAATWTTTPPSVATAVCQTDAVQIRAVEAQTVGHDARAQSTQTMNSERAGDRARHHMPSVGCMTDGPEVTVPYAERRSDSAPPGYSLQQHQQHQRHQQQHLLDMVNSGSDPVPRGSGARYALADRPGSGLGSHSRPTSGATDALMHRAPQPALVAYRPAPTSNVEINAFGVREIIDDGAIYLPISHAPSPQPATKQPVPGSAQPERVSSAHNKAVPRSSKFVVVKRSMNVGLGFE